MTCQPPSAAGRAGLRRSPRSRCVADGFYRDLVWNLRNGVVAVTHDGRVAVMNEIAYRILGLEPGAPTSAATSPRS